MGQKKHIDSALLENLGFKIIAFLITIVLWLTILGRRDLIYTVQRDIEVIPTSQFHIIGQTAESVEIKIAGPRGAIKKYIELINGIPLPIEVKSGREGLVNVEIPTRQLDLPGSVKLVSIKPSRIKIEMVSKTNTNNIKNNK